MKTRLCIVSLVLFGLNPCLAAERPVDFSDYRRVPDNLNSRVLRALLKCIPYTNEHAFHGCYGGSGNMGGCPIDIVDAICRKHDIVYATARAVPSLRIADRVFVAELSKLDPQGLTAEAQDFRRRAIKFMSGKGARYLGKPPGTWLRRAEPNLAGPIDEQKLARFFHTPVGRAETVLLVSMIGKVPAPASTSSHRLAARPIKHEKNAAFVAKFSSTHRGKL